MAELIDDLAQAAAGTVVTAPSVRQANLTPQVGQNQINCFVSPYLQSKPVNTLSRKSVVGKFYQI